MIKIIVLDDERVALRQMKKVLQIFSNVQICGLFTDPDEFLQAVRTERVDLVLIDMVMPDANGLAVARTAQSLRPDISVVFVTAYEKYAAEAFEIEALDYVLKPLDGKRLGRTLQRFLRRQETLRDGQRKGRNAISVNCFGRLTIVTEQGKVRFINAKAEELLAYLAHHAGGPVNKAKIIEALWPNRDVVRAQANLYSTVYQLRKDLEAYGLRAVISQSRSSGGSYQLNLPHAESDMDLFEQAYQTWKNGQLDQSLVERAIEHYHGGYLHEHDYRWALSRQQELEVRYAELLEALVTEYVRNGRLYQALPLLQKWADLFPYSEHVHAKMIALFLLLKQPEQARAYYYKVSNETYSVELGYEFGRSFEQIAANPAALFDTFGGLA